MAKITTRVGQYQIEVRKAHRPALWWFAAGAHGKKEAGVYAFWTSVLRRRKGKSRIWGRALVGLSAGDRCDRMRFEMRHSKDADDRKIYGRYWLKFLKKGAAIRYIRPSTAREVKLWMASHKSDARFARKVRFG